MVKLVIKKELRKALPALTTDEKEQLRINIEADGKVTDPILYAVLDGENVIVDGMHRYEIAEPAGIPYRTMKAPASVGTTIDEAMIWVLDHALGRRNLLDKASVRKLRGGLYNRLKRPDGGHGKQEPRTPDEGRAINLSARPQDGGRETKESSKNKRAGESDAAEKVAKKHGGSAATVRREGAYVEALQSCVQPIQRLVDMKLADPTAAEMKALAKLDKGVQNTVARDVRTGKTLAQAMAPYKPAKRKRGGGKVKTAAATLVDTAMKSYFSPMAKILSKIAAANGGEGEQFKKADAGLNECGAGLEEMRKGKR